MGRSICLLWIVSACYTANPPEGLACSETGHCPEGQSCDFDTLTCVKTLPPAMQLKSISSGYAHTCGIDLDGGLWCWGLDNTSQLGNGQNASIAVPTRVGTDTNWKSVAAGYMATCGVRTDNSLWCWGDSQDLGTAAAVPTQFGVGMKWQAASAAQYQTCALDSSGGVWCSGFQVPQLVQTPLTHATSIATGTAFVCAIDDSQQLQCWGSNSAGQIGDGTQMDPTVPYTHPGKWKSVATGGDFACAIDSASHLWCWGNGYDGQNGQLTGNTTPMQIDTDSYIEVSAGGLFMCAVRSDHAIVCFGNNPEGELGAVTVGVRSLPVEMPYIQSWQSVAAGGMHTCALDINNDTWCWGWNHYGQLGNGEMAFQQTPVMVDAGPWLTVSTGLSTTCALRGDHSAWCWGENGAGQLGDGTTTRHAAPNQVGSDTDWQLISAGRTHTCGIRSGQLYCWGDNRNAELGQGSTLPDNITSPVQVGKANDWIDVSAASSSTMALEIGGASGVLSYWGGAMSVATPSMTFGSFSWLTGESSNVEGAYPSQTVLDASSHAARVDENGISPLMPTGEPQWTSLWHGFGFHCGIAMSIVECWGSGSSPNNDYQLGVTTAPPADVVVAATGFTMTPTSVVTGFSATCAIGQDQGLYCWGNPLLVPVNGLSDATPDAQHVIPGASWMAVSLAWEHGCAIQTNGSLWCWGDNLAGELGTGPVSKNRPVRVTKEGP